MEEIETLYEVGERLANSSQWPNWYKGNEFRAVRDRSLRGRRKG
jgi:hypothetical protein